MYGAQPMKIYDKNGDYLNETQYYDEYLEILELIKTKPDDELI
jgi:hypothetical protein